MTGPDRQEPVQPYNSGGPFQDDRPQWLTPPPPKRPLSFSFKLRVACVVLNAATAAIYTASGHYLLTVIYIVLTALWSALAYHQYRLDRG